MAALIWTIILLLAAAWFFGTFAVDVGWWINLLLVIALLGIVYQLFIYPLLITRATEGGHVHDTHVRPTHTHDVHDHDHDHDHEL